MHRGVQTGPENGVHDQITVLEQRAQDRTELGGGFHREAAPAGSLKLFQIGGGIACQCGGRGQQYHARLAAPLPEETRRYEAVPAVLSLAGDDGDGLPAQRAEEPFHLLDHRLPGILHETEARNVPRLDGGAVQLAHLRGGDEFHG